MFICWFPHVYHLNLLSSLSLPLIPLHLLSQRLHISPRMQLLLTTFLQTAQGNLPSSVTFPAISLPIIMFSLRFILNSFNSNTSS